MRQKHLQKPTRVSATTKEVLQDSFTVQHDPGANEYRAEIVLPPQTATSKTVLA